MSNVQVTNCEFRAINKGNILAGANLTFNEGLDVKCLVVNGQNGPFLSMPRQKGKDGNWYNQVFISDEDTRRDINDDIVGRYSAWTNKETASDNAAQGEGDPF